LSLAIVAEDKIDYHVRRQPLKFRAILSQIIPIPMNSPYRFRQRRPGFAAMKHRNVVPLGGQRFNNERPDEPGATDDQDLHLSTISKEKWWRAITVRPF